MAFIPWSLFMGQKTFPPRDGTLVELAVSQHCESLKPTATDVIRAKVAATAPARQRGLSHRKAPLTRDEGMLFLFESPSPVGFWMKDTLVPLQILFFSEQGALTGTREMPVESDPGNPKMIYQSPGPARWALEVAPRRLAARLGDLLCVRSSTLK